MGPRRRSRRAWAKSALCDFLEAQVQVGKDWPPFSSLPLLMQTGWHTNRHMGGQADRPTGMHAVFGQVEAEHEVSEPNLDISHASGSEDRARGLRA